MFKPTLHIGYCWLHVPIISFGITKEPIEFDGWLMVMTTQHANVQYLQSLWMFDLVALYIVKQHYLQSLWMPNLVAVYIV